ncbi:MAG: hypothetical protein EHM89_19590, partial [Acidobacteria bacterium]
APVADARVTLIDQANKQLWEGKTGPDGVAVGPGVPRRSRWLYEETPSFIVVAEKDGDIAYVGSNWHEGISPWEFGHTYDPTEARPVPRGTIFSDRGVYRPGEEVHFKAILRADAPSGMSLFRSGTPVVMSTRDGQDKEIDKRTIKLSDWSSAEWTLRLPEDGALGTYRVTAQVTGYENPQEPDETSSSGVGGRFLVAAYRRPDFRVDATLASDSAIAGATLTGVVNAKYLFGASMGKRPVTWRTSRLRLCGAPVGVAENFTDERFAFGEECDHSPETEQVGSDETTLDASGQFGMDIQTGVGNGKPYRYTFEGDVEDASRQRIAGRASFLVHPAPWYVGVLRPSYFVDQKSGLQTAIVTVSPDGKVAPGVPVTITLQQTQWHSVRRAEGQGFYTWETTREQTKVGTWTVTTADQPVPLSIPLASGGLFQVSAVARDSEGHVTETNTSFYALGAGYTAWERFDHNRITLVPEKRIYRPGETARLMVQSPWERATALLTTEREGVRTHRQFELTSSQQSISV